MDSWETHFKKRLFLIGMITMMVLFAISLSRMPTDTLTLSIITQVITILGLAGALLTIGTLWLDVDIQFLGMEIDGLYKDFVGKFPKLFEQTRPTIIKLFVERLNREPTDYEVRKIFTNTLIDQHKASKQAPT